MGNVIGKMNSVAFCRDCRSNVEKVLSTISIQEKISPFLEDHNYMQTFHDSVKITSTLNYFSSLSTAGYMSKCRRARNGKPKGVEFANNLYLPKEINAFSYDL